MRIIKMTVKDFLGVCERPVESGSDDREVLGHLLVVDIVALLVYRHLDLLIEWRVGNGGIAGSEGTSQRLLSNISIALGACPPSALTAELLKP